MTEALSTPAQIKVASDYTLDTYSIKENHYTYDIADDHSVDDLSCPLCGGTDCLEAIEL
jgi:hypothetical protein